MDIVKISAMGIVTAFCVVLLREQKSEVAMLVGIAGGCIILLSVIDYFTQVFSTLSSIAEKTGIPTSIYKTVMKIISIGYIADFSAGIVEDSGQKALAEKIILGGKLIIMVLALPIITMLFDTIAGVLA
ncbi:MAG: stage III sporulation protein AD [Clostridia bacterium]|jgi:stage III sporulation protein AD|uniref:stage III sporulation protein AD n=1 Tax=Pumilibacter muris TaxID=2941510 RepID=UPI00203BCA6E|nr:stage III sporulation protein AD [Pumilibacter muris]MCI8595972.1 stage III sporulation protein AD [Clostridia bacterium]